MGKNIFVMKRFFLLMCIIIFCSGCSKVYYDNITGVKYRKESYRVNVLTMPFTESHTIPSRLMGALDEIRNQQETLRVKVIQEAMKWREDQPQQYYEYKTSVDYSMGLLTNTVYATCYMTVYDIEYSRVVVR